MDHKETDPQQPMDTGADPENQPIRNPDEEGCTGTDAPLTDPENVFSEDNVETDGQTRRRSLSAPATQCSYSANERLTPPQNTRYLARRLQRATLVSPERIRTIFTNSQFTIPVLPPTPQGIERTFEQLVRPEPRSFSDSDISSRPVDRSQTESLRQAVMDITPNIQRIVNRSTVPTREGSTSEQSFTIAEAHQTVPHVRPTTSGGDGNLRQGSSCSSRSGFSPVPGCGYGTDTTVTTPEEYRYESAEDSRDGSSTGVLNGNTTHNPNFDQEAPLPQDSSDEEPDDAGRKRHSAESSRFSKRRR